MSKVNAIAQRMNFDNAVEILTMQGIDAAKARLTQSYLRAEVLASATQGTYSFPIIINQADPNGFTTQQKLNLQDAFVVSEFGVFIAKPSGAADTTFPLITYDNETVFSTANTAAGVRTMYNGKLVVTLNNSVIVPAWDVLRCKVVPRTQQAIPAGAKDSEDFSADGFYPVEPNLIISGAGNYQIQMVLPAAMAAVEANQRIVLIARGILAQNVTSVQ